MINSNDRKLALSGWLMENGKSEYDSPLKLQKFLLLYELFTKTSGEVADLSNLKGYKRGPVFSNVWGDYTHDRSEFDNAAKLAYSNHKYEPELDRAKKSRFIVSILSESELSALTHKMNIWNAKKDRILNGERQVSLHEQDFNNGDEQLVKLLDKMYPTSLIDDSHVISIDNHYFVFNRRDAAKLTEQNFDTLSALCENPDLENPIYAEIDEKGRIIVD